MHLYLPSRRPQGPRRTRGVKRRRRTIRNVKRHPDRVRLRRDARRRRNHGRRFVSYDNALPRRVRRYPNTMVTPPRHDKVNGRRSQRHSRLQPRHPGRHEGNLPRRYKTFRINRNHANIRVRGTTNRCRGNHRNTSRRNVYGRLRRTPRSLLSELLRINHTIRRRQHTRSYFIKGNSPLRSPISNPNRTMARRPTPNNLRTGHPPRSNHRYHQSDHPVSASRNRHPRRMRRNRRQSSNLHSYNRPLRPTRCSPPNRRNRCSTHYRQQRPRRHLRVTHGKISLTRVPRTRTNRRTGTNGRRHRYPTGTTTRPLNRVMRKATTPSSNNVPTTMTSTRRVLNVANRRPRRNRSPRPRRDPQPTYRGNHHRTRSITNTSNHHRHHTGTLRLTSNFVIHINNRVPIRRSNPSNIPRPMPRVPRLRGANTRYRRTTNTGR